MDKRKILIELIVFFMFCLFIYNCGDGNAKGDGGQDNDSTAVTENDSTGKEMDENKSKEDEELIPVEVTTIKRGSISDYILLSTNLETEQMADIYSRIQGLVQRNLVEEGDFVKKNQLLATLEADEYKLAAERARLNYFRQKADFDRLTAMFKQDLLSNEEHEQAKYTTDGLKIEWEQAKLNLSYTKIRSPITGVIGDRFTKPGDRIQPTDRLFTVINTNEMIGVVYVPEKELGNIEKNQVAYITSDNLRGKRFIGWVKRVSPVVDPQSGTFKVTIGVKNKNKKLRSGMFVNAHIVTDTHEKAVLIPKTAIVYENEYMNVFVVKDSVAHKITLIPGFQDHEKVEALSDINEGDKVIVVGQAGLKDQTRVKIAMERENEVAMRRSQVVYRGI